MLKTSCLSWKYSALQGAMRSLSIHFLYLTLVQKKNSHAPVFHTVNYFRITTNCSKYAVFYVDRPAVLGHSISTLSCALSCKFCVHHQSLCTYFLIVPLSLFFPVFVEPLCQAYVDSNQWMSEFITHCQKI